MDWMLLVDSGVLQSPPESSHPKFASNTWDVFRVENLSLEGFSNALNR